MIKQRYKHDCAKCNLIGHYKNYDVYTCANDRGGSLILRYGNEPIENRSYPIFILLQNFILKD